MTDVPIPSELAVDEEPFTVDELDGLLYEREHFPETPPGEVSPTLLPVARWAIDSDGAAEWALRRLAEIDAELDAHTVQAAAWAAKIRAWFDDKTKRAAPRRAFFAAHLERYGIQKRRENPKAATLRFPSGVIKTTDHSPKLVVNDEKALIAWFHTVASEARTKELVRTVESVPVTELRAAVELVEVPTKFVFSPCGCSWQPLTPTLELARGWPVATGVEECPSCGEDALVAQWPETILLPSLDGQQVVGVSIEERHITAKAVPS